MSTHVLVIRQESERVRGSFPDYPSLTVEAGSFAEALTLARQLLEEHLSVLPLDERVPTPRTLGEVLTELSGPVAAVEITVTESRSPAVRINITLPEDLLLAVDRAAEAHSLSRSRFLARAVEAVVAGDRHDGLHLPLNSDLLAAVDTAAQAHQMNRLPFLIRLIETAVSRSTHTTAK